MPELEIKSGSFAHTIATAAHGVINNNVTDDLKRLTAELQEVQRTLGGNPKGKLTLALSFEMNDNGMFEIEADTTIKHPRRARPKAFLYAAKDGTLQEEDPRQGTLDLGGSKDVSTAAAASVRSIADHRMAQAGDRP